MAGSSLAVGQDSGFRTWGEVGLGFRAAWLLDGFGKASLLLLFAGPLTLEEGYGFVKGFGCLEMGMEGIESKGLIGGRRSIAENMVVDALEAVVAGS